jgi:hypothetical protein
MVRGPVLLAAIVALLAAAGPARAGTYQVSACAGGGNDSWLGFNSNETAFDLNPGCPYTAITQASASARAGFFEAAWWRLTAPPGTVIDRLRIARYGYRFLDVADMPEGGVNQGGWLTEAYTEDGQVRYSFGREACSIAAGQYLCEFGSKDPNAAVDLDLDANQVTYQVACVRGSGCRSGSDAAFPLAAITIYSAVATLRDDSAPTLTAGGPLLAGGWRRPDDEIVLDADDNTGIGAVTASAGAATGSLAVPCNYTRPAPCAKVAGGRLRIGGLAEGAQSVVVTVTDAAGNPTTSTHAVNVDGTPPSALLQPPSGRTLVVKVADELSGVAGGQILVGGTPLPTALAGGRLTARLPSGDPARADVRVTVSDVAGNTAAGVPPRIAVADRVRTRNGRAVTLRGRVTTPAGQALANVPLQATATVRRRGATAQPAGGATTDARGRFALRLPAGASRTVRVIVPATGATLRAVRGVSVRVPASSTIHASRRVVSAGGRVTFSGTIRRAGQPLPTRGLVVVLQGRSAGAWRTFADTRTTRSGRWRASYRFRGVPGRYPVRLRIRRANGFPFELGYSPAATVRVR